MPTETLPESVLSRLSDAQKAAVYHPGGPLLVVSGAGSGKTRALTFRAARLVNSGVEPERILVSTFTNRAANEFRHRLEKILGPSVARLNMGTLHSTGARILRMFGGEAGFNPEFRIFDPRDCYRTLYTALRDLDIPEARLSANYAYEQITRYKEQLQTPDDAIENAADSFNVTDREVAQVYQRYSELLLEAGAMDFGDLVGNTVRLLERVPTVRDKTGLQHLLVDEFQDTDPAQFKMLQLLLCPDRNLTAVGDVDQAIYRFRGADHRIMLNFEKHFPGARTVTLGQNYRSTKTIVSAAEQVIIQNTGRIKHSIWTDNGEGYPIIVSQMGDEIEEAAEVANQIERVKQELGLEYKDIAVLYRTNIQSQPLEHQFLQQQIPYQVVGSRFFDRKEIRDVVSYLRVMHQPNNPLTVEEAVNRPRRILSNESWQAILDLRRQNPAELMTYLRNPESLPILPKEKRALGKWIAMIAGFFKFGRQATLLELTHEILDVSGVREYHTKRDTDEKKATGTSAVDNLDRLLEIMEQHFSGQAAEVLPEFIEYVDLMSDDGVDAPVNGVQLMTLHSAKGTEYPVVFMVGVEEKMLPFWRALQDYEHPLEALEEERRLMYVGMTRAKTVLYMFHVASRRIRSGQTVRCAPSRFIGEIPREFKLEWHRDRRGGLAA
jgi:DNA helicase-2/ATP-dependent DNA helicase PcrA